MQVSKLKFSKQELDVLQDSNFFLVKHQATLGIQNLLGELCQSLETVEKNEATPVSGLNEKSGKIFRGENYRLLPYVVLDYPRYFSKDSIFAFRSMFWWGNGFSFTLHLQGKAFHKLCSTIEHNLKLLVNLGVFVCVNKESPWEYHYAEENYQPLEEWLKKNESVNLKQKEFVKFSRRLDLENYSQVTEFGTETWLLFKKLCS